MPSKVRDHDDLRQAWTQLYKHDLPALAKERNPKQKTWPVHLDHCFARIILDNAVGTNKPWMEVVKAPATNNMTGEQLHAALDLGWAIVEGRANLEELDRKSLELRGKQGPRGKRKATEDAAPAVKDSPPVKKRKSNKETDIRSHFFPSPTSHQESKPKSKPKRSQGGAPPTPPEDTTPPQSNPDSPELKAARTQIATSPTLTPFRRYVLTLLTHVPRGRYTTYKAMSDYISTHRNPTCARAIGQAMRNNPYAPMVPCHRVLAASGKLGGFGGDWGEEGKHAGEKRRLLGEEGVKFREGKVVGEVFVEWPEKIEVG